MLHWNASAGALAAARICVYGVWLILVASTPVEWYAEIPYELFEPWGLLRGLPDTMYQKALTLDFQLTFKAVLLGLLVLLILGVRPFAPLGMLAFAMLLFHDGVMKGWQGTVNHGQAMPLYAALILPLFPAADGLSVFGDPYPRRKPASVPGGRYAPGLLAVSLVLCFTYSFTGIRRVALGGIEVFTGDALLASFALRSLEYRPFPFEYGLLPLTTPWLSVMARAGFLVVTIFEILSPFVLISRRLRYAWLTVIIGFHFATLFVMNIFFWENLILVLVFLTGVLHFRTAQAVHVPRRKSIPSTAP